MIIPDKYINLQNSIFGTSALIIKTLGNKYLSINKLWKKCEKKLNISYIKFMHCVIFMFSTGMSNYNNEGEIYNENIKLKNN